MGDGHKNGTTHAYGRVPFEAICTGAIRSLDCTAAKIYIVLCAHTNADWTSRPSIKRLAALAGCSSRTVSRAIQRLEAARLVVVQRPRGGHRASRYLLVSSPFSSASVRACNPAAGFPGVTTRCQCLEARGDTPARHASLYRGDTTLSPLGGEGGHPARHPDGQGCQTEGLEVTNQGSRGDTLGVLRTDEQKNRATGGAEAFSAYLRARGSSDESN